MKQVTALAPWACVPLVLAAVVWRGYTNFHATIPSPTEWVAFDASFTTISQGQPSPGIKNTIVPRMVQPEWTMDYRDRWFLSNFSNTSVERQYEYSRERWRAYPVRMPPGGYHPPLKSLATKGLKPSSTAVQGFEVYLFTGPDGEVLFQVPALNFFAVASQFRDIREEELRYKGS